MYLQSGGTIEFQCNKKINDTDVKNIFLFYLLSLILYFAENCASATRQ